MRSPATAPPSALVPGTGAGTGQTGPETAPRTQVGVDDLVIGEGVALDLPPAPMLARIGSGLIDLLITGASLLLGLVLSTAVAMTADEALLWVAYVLTLVFTFLVLPTGLETATRGRSIGKYALGLRTVRDDGGPIAFSHALTRALIGYVEIYLMLAAPAFLASLVHHRGKRLGDMAAGTYVISDRASLQLPTPSWVPPQLYPWAQKAEVSSMPAGIAARVRELLVRAHELHPAARDHAARSLRAEVQASVSPPPPAGTPDLAYLGAVMAVRRERETARLRVQAEQRRRLLQRD